jgi:hypothetical protein
MMGGADNIIARSRKLYDEGRYLHAQEIVRPDDYDQPLGPRTGHAGQEDV